jgi:hypothetical protein
MSNNWYYAKDRQRCGPFTFGQFQQLAAAGLLTPTDMVWNEGASYWVSANEVPGLFSAPQLSSASTASPRSEPSLPITAPTTIPEVSVGWDLVERGVLNIDDAPIDEPFPGNQSRPAERRKWEDYGESLVAVPAPRPRGSTPSTYRAGEYQQHGAPGREVIREVQPAQPRSSQRRKTDTMLMIAVALALLAFIGSAAAFLGSFFLDGPFLILSGLLLILACPLFLIVGVPVIVTGRVPYARARFSDRPRYARLEGVAALLNGLGAAFVGLMIVAYSIQWDSKPPPLAHRPPAKQCHKDEKAALQYQGKKTPFALWLVPETWRQSEKMENPAAEVEFMHKDGEAGAKVIALRIQMPISILKKAVLENLMKVDKDATIIREEARLVNGTEVLCLTINAKIKGVPFTYHGYYYSGEQGSIQVLTWTGQNLFQELQPELDRFLNGFEIVKKEP